MAKTKTQAERLKLPKGYEGGFVCRSVVDKKGNVDITYNPDQIHNVVIGTTGSGKTQTCIMPLILSVGCTDGSLVVLDPKGELYGKTSSFLKQKGYKIYTMDYLEPSAGSCFNQLFLVENEYREHLPNMYLAKACKSILKVIDFITSGGQTNKFEFFQVKEYNTNKDSEIIRKKRFASRTKNTSGNITEIFEICPSQNFNNEAIMEMENINDVETLINMLRELYVCVFDQIQKDYLREKPVDVTSCIYNNEDIKNKAERTVHAVMDILDTISVNNLKHYYEAKIKINERNIRGKEEGSKFYKLSVDAIETYKQYIETIDAEGLTINILYNYLMDLEADHQAIWELAEKEAKKNAGAIATILVPKNPNAKDSFWDDTARSLQQALIMLVCRESEKEDSRHLGSVNMILSKLCYPLDDKGTTELSLISKRLTDDDMIRKAMTNVNVSAEKTRQSIVSSAVAATDIFADPTVVDQAAHNDFNPENLVKEKSAVFLITPGEDDGGSAQYTILSTLFLEEIYSCLNKQALLSNGTLPRPVYFALDELGNIPAIPALGSKVSLARSKNMRFTIVLQSYEQLKKKYNDQSDTIRENSNILYLLSNDSGTAKQISERIGKETIEINSLSQSSSKNKDTSTSQNTNLMGRELFTPQELMLFKKGEGLYIQQSQNPYKTHLAMAWQWPIYKWLQQHEILSVHSVRNQLPVNYYCPDVENFTAAYELNAKGCILDRYLTQTLSHLELKKDETYYEDEVAWD